MRRRRRGDAALRWPMGPAGLSRSNALQLLVGHARIRPAAVAFRSEHSGLYRERRARTRYSPACLPCQHGGSCRRGSPQRHHLGSASVRRVDAAPGPGSDRRVHRVPAGATGAPRETHRPRSGQQRCGPALVALLLLHIRRQSGPAQTAVCRRSRRGAPCRRCSGRLIFHARPQGIYFRRGRDGRPIIERRVPNDARHPHAEGTPCRC